MERREGPAKDARPPARSGDSRSGVGEVARMPVEPGGVVFGDAYAVRTDRCMARDWGAPCQAEIGSTVGAPAGFPRAGAPDALGTPIERLSRPLAGHRVSGPARG